MFLLVLFMFCAVTYFSEFKQEIISSFYYTLQTLLSNDKVLDGLVELIYYKGKYGFLNENPK